jgi:serine/threonine protein phosphatase PrpC
MEIRPGIEFASLSDVGLIRKRNEDSCSYWEAEDEAEFQRKGRFAAVADGMGGHEGGEHASAIAVETLSEVYRNSAAEDPAEALAAAMRQAHENIRAYAQSHPEFRNMGTTCTAVVIRGDRLWFAHVGDSRLYLFRGGKYGQLTRDHSYVNQLVEHGLISSADAEHHPQRNVLTSALGISRDEIATEISAEPRVLEPGDQLLLCSDGLWTHVADREMLSITGEHAPAAACEELVRLAKERGGTDNITVQILRFDSLPPASNQQANV